MGTWWSDFATASSQAQVSATSPADAWLSSAAGGIAGGIEGALVAFAHDLWDMIVGPLEVFLGASLIIIAFLLLFKDDIAAAGRMVGAMRP